MSTNIKQVIDGFLLCCMAEGFLRYATHYDWPYDITAIITNHLREFRAYLRETHHRFNIICPRAMKPIISTHTQKYCQALSALLNWSVSEGILETNSLVKIKVLMTEKKVVKSLNSSEVNQFILHFVDTFEGIRNKAIILVLADCGLKLG